MVYERQLSQLGEPLGLLIALAARKGTGHEPHRHILRVHSRTQLLVILLVAHSTPPQVNEHFWDVNLDRANVIAGPAQR